ncbi:MAG: substrate-binding domain-containing protein [Chloroflexi bacterium]|nr:substrate-binding domain-containing protein [Chloroflexota bacterium]
MLLTLALVSCGPGAPQPSAVTPASTSVTATAPTAAPTVATTSAVASPGVAASPAAVPAASPPPAASSAGGVQPTAVPRSGSERELILATTTSTQDSGLLDVLVPRFQRQSGYQVKTIAVGTGAALALGGRGEADVVLVHAPQAELQWMAQGNGTRRLLVMHNDFVLVGPPDDPARLRGVNGAVNALRTLADRKATFVSRGDGSGTHLLEQQLWKAVGIDPKGQSWYVESGSGMGQTLTIADQRRGYTISDRATWLARKSQIDLPIVLEGDPVLFNVYHVMPVNPNRFPNLKLNVDGGNAFADFMVHPDTQAMIAVFGKDRYGQALFIADAGKNEAAIAP